MFGRVLAIGLNTYREAVRARILFGLLGLALATTAYSIVVAAMSLHQERRVISDLGAASVSLYSVFVAIVIAATSLHRELELKTVYPILTRRLRRHEYLFGKYLGTLLTIMVFVAINTGAVLGILAAYAGQSTSTIAGATVGAIVILVALLLRAKRQRVFVLLPWSLAFLAIMAVLAAPADGDRRLVLAAACLTIFEVVIVAGVATLFASFSSPFLTAIFTTALFIVGRSADTLANLPARVVGAHVSKGAAVLAKVVPNLHTYVPPRPLLLGEVPGSPVWEHVGRAGANAVFYAAVLLALSVVIFKKRDFQ